MSRNTFVGTKVKWAAGPVFAVVLVVGGIAAAKLIGGERQTNHSEATVKKLNPDFRMFDTDIRPVDLAENTVENVEGDWEDPGEVSSHWFEAYESARADQTLKSYVAFFFGDNPTEDAEAATKTADLKQRLFVSESAEQELQVVSREEFGELEIDTEKIISDPVGFENFIYGVTERFSASGLTDTDQEILAARRDDSGLGFDNKLDHMNTVANTEGNNSENYVTWAGKLTIADQGPSTENAERYDWDPETREYAVLVDFVNDGTGWKLAGAENIETLRTWDKEKKEHVLPRR